MAGIVLSGSCSSRLLLRDREAGSNGASLAQYNGLKAVDTMHLPSSRTPKLSCSGIWLKVFVFYWHVIMG